MIITLNLLFFAGKKRINTETLAHLLINPPPPLSLVRTICCIIVLVVFGMQVDMQVDIQDIKASLKPKSIVLEHAF